MNPVNNDQQFEYLRSVLLPILAEASIGHFDKDVPHRKSDARELTEILMGVQVLLETIRQQQQTIRESEAQLHDIQNRTTEILARVLDRSLPEGKTKP